MCHFNCPGNFQSFTVTRFPFHLPFLGISSLSKSDEHLKKPGCATAKGVTAAATAAKSATAVATSVLKMLTCHCGRAWGSGFRCYSSTEYCQILVVVFFKVQTNQF